MADTLRRVGAGEEDPPCEHCGGILKSATVSFGQSLDPAVLERARRAVRECDVLLAVGTSLTVHPAAGLVGLAARSGAAVVILNAEPTPYDRLAAVLLRGGASELVPALLPS